MNHTTRSLVVAFAVLFALLKWAPADAGDVARTDYSSARTAVQDFEDAARPASASGAGPETLANAVKLREQAAAALDRCRRSLGLAEQDGSLGEYSAQVLRQYTDKLDRDFTKAVESLPAEAAARPEHPSSQPSASSQPSGPAEGDGVKELMERFGRWIREMEEAHERAERTYGYRQSAGTLRSAFEKSRVTSIDADVWGQWIWLGVHDTYGRIDGSVRLLRKQADALAKSQSGGEQQLVEYFQQYMDGWRQQRDRFFYLAECLVELDVRRASAIEKGRAAGKASYEVPEVASTLRRRRAILAQITDPALLREPAIPGQRNRFNPAKEASQARRKGSDYERYESAQVGWERGEAAANLGYALAALKKKAEDGEVPTPEEIRAVLDSLPGLFGERLDRFVPLLERAGEHLEKGQDVLNFIDAATSLFRASQGNADDAVEPLRDLQSFIKTLKPFAEKVPGIGGFLDYYENSLGVAADTLSEVDATTRARRRAGNDLWRQVIEGQQSTELDQSLGELEAQAPELPAAESADTSRSPARLNVPELNDADRRNIEQMTALERRLFLGAREAHDRRMFAAVAQRDALDRARANKAPDLVQREEEWQQTVQDLRDSWEILAEHQLRYETKVAELTRIGLSTHAPR